MIYHIFLYLSVLYVIIAKNFITLTNILTNCENAFSRRAAEKKFYNIFLNS